LSIKEYAKTAIGKALIHTYSVGISEIMSSLPPVCAKFQVRFFHGFRMETNDFSLLHILSRQSKYVDINASVDIE
jgi:hypothetical protein